MKTLILASTLALAAITPAFSQTYYFFDQNDEAGKVGGIGNPVSIGNPQGVITWDTTSAIFTTSDPDGTKITMPNNVNNIAVFADADGGGQNDVTATAITLSGTYSDSPTEVRANGYRFIGAFNRSGPLVISPGRTLTLWSLDNNSGVLWHKDISGGTLYVNGSQNQFGSHDKYMEGVPDSEVSSFVRVNVGGRFKIQTPSTSSTLPLLYTGGIEVLNGQLALESRSWAGGPITIQEIGISGNGGVIVSGGNVIYDAPGTYLGKTTISWGTLLLNVGNALPPGTNVEFNNSWEGDVWLYLQGHSHSVGAISSSQIAGNGILNSISSTQSVLTLSGDLDTTFARVIGASRGATNGNNIRLVRAGNGVTTLTNNNPYTGGTLIQSGGLTLGHAQALGTGGLELEGGILDLQGFSPSLPTYNQSGGTLDGTGTLTSVAGYELHAGLANAKLGTGAITKTGSGTFTLGSGGRLHPDSTLEIGDGAFILGGNETLASLDVTGGTLAPSGTLTITGTVDLAGTLAMDVNGTTAGTEHDQVLVGQALTLGGDLSLSFDNDLAPAYGVEITLIEADSISGAFANLPSGSRIALPDGVHSCAILYGAESGFPDRVVLTDFSDDQPPVLTLPDDLVVEATGPGGTEVEFVVSAVDDFQGTVEAVATPASGTLFPVPSAGDPQLPVGVTTVNVSASDVGGNEATGTFTITVEDTTAPAFVTVTASETFEADQPSGKEVKFAATATDLVDENVTIGFSIPDDDDPLVITSPHVFPLGATEVTATATDFSGNQTITSFTITVEDTTAPEFVTITGSGTYEADDPSGKSVEFAATASDAVDENVIILFTVPGDEDPLVITSPHLFEIGSHTVTVTATDASGNFASETFNVEVTGKPKIFVMEMEGDEIENGTTILDFGSVDLSDPGETKSLTVRNDGTLPLVLGTLTLDGADAAQYSVTPPLELEVEPGETTTFSITFAPSLVGTRTATLHLASNDPDPAAAVFDISLTGVGISDIPPAFDSPPVIMFAGVETPATFTASVTGPPGAVVKLEASTDLGVTDEWRELALLALDGSGSGAFNGVEDPESIGSPHSFFRLKID